MRRVWGQEIRLDLILQHDDFRAFLWGFTIFAVLFVDLAEVWRQILQGFRFWCVAGKEAVH